MISRGASLQKWGDDWLKYLSLRNVRKSLNFKLFLFPVKPNGSNQCNVMPHVSCFKSRLSSTRLQEVWYHTQISEQICDLETGIEIVSKPSV